MSLSRRIARPLVGSIFIFGGLDSLQHPGTKTGAADKVVGPLQKTGLPLPSDSEQLVKINAAVQVGAAGLLSIGRLPRLSSLVLAGSLIPTTLAGHRFWEEAEPGAKAGQQVHFLKNLAILGGLLIAAFDTDGEPSLGYRAKRQAKAARKQAKAARRQAASAATRASGAVTGS